MTDTPAPAAPAPAAPPAAPAGSPSAAAGTAGAAGTPWHASVDQGIRDFWNAKRYDISDPAKLVESVTRSYQGAEKHLGVPSEQLLRVPQPNADSTEVNAYWNKIGVPLEAKDYDLSAVKFSDGSAMDQAFSDTLRAGLHEARVPKDKATALATRLIKHMEDNDKAETAEITAELQKQNQALRTNWGSNYEANMVVARSAMERLGSTAGLTKEQIDSGWDALSKTGGIGASYAMQMLYNAGVRMGEHPFLTGGQGSQGPQITSREQARAEIDALLKDRDFQQRILNHNVEALRKWTNLHQILAGTISAAA